MSAQKQAGSVNRSIKLKKSAFAEEANLVKKDRPVAVGTGFIALDVVLNHSNEGSAKAWAGGTCGNVLSILAYLGWRTYPIASLGLDRSSKRLVDDLKSVGVNDRFIQYDKNRNTPIVIEKIKTLATGKPSSRFVWKCLNCGEWLPGYQPVLSKDIKLIIPKIPNPTVFFFDRLSRGALDLAQAAAAKGALIVFEPSSIGEERLFREAVAVCHILKYSHDRLTGVADSLKTNKPLLEIETQGEKGLRYRFKTGNWTEMAAFPVDEIKDSVGAGDWCTAGIIYGLGKNGAVDLSKASESALKNSIKLGQALSALTCMYDGARGSIYAMTKPRFRLEVDAMFTGSIKPAKTSPKKKERTNNWKFSCPKCT